MAADHDRRQAAPRFLGFFCARLSCRAATMSMSITLLRAGLRRRLALLTLGLGVDQLFNVFAVSVVIFGRLVEFEDEETGTLGEAPDREVLIEEEMEYQRLRGYIRVTAEAVELCEQCEGEGSIPVEDGIVSICDACGGRIGILSSFKRGRGAEMISTQLHLRAAS
jgi:hypothetical protein